MFQTHYNNPKNINIKNTKSVGIQGGYGSFNHQAWLEYCKSYDIDVDDIKIKFLYNTKNVLEALQSKTIDVGQFAIVNNSGGFIEETWNILGMYNFNVLNFYSIPISHNLMIPDDIDFSNIRYISTHEQVLKQCENNIQKYFPKLELVRFPNGLIDNAEIAENIANGNIKNTAYLGPQLLADIHHMRIIQSDMQDNFTNRTTFGLFYNSGSNSVIDI